MHNGLFALSRFGYIIKCKSVHAIPSIIFPLLHWQRFQMFLSKISVVDIRKSAITNSRQLRPYTTKRKLLVVVQLQKLSLFCPKQSSQLNAACKVYNYNKYITSYNMSKYWSQNGQFIAASVWSYRGFTIAIHPDDYARWYCYACLYRGFFTVGD